MSKDQPSPGPLRVLRLKNSINKLRAVAAWHEAPRPVSFPRARPTRGPWREDACAPDGLRHDSDPVEPSETVPLGPLPLRLHEVGLSRSWQFTVLDLVQSLGHGASGSVYAARLGRVHGSNVAVKIISKKDMEPSVLQAVLNEQAALKRLIGLPRVLQMEASFHDARNFYIVTSLYANGDLEAFLDDCSRVPLPLLKPWLADIVWGLEALHKKGIIHRDLKPANVYIDDRWHLVIGDFGLARVFDSNGSESFDIRPYWLSEDQRATADDCCVTRTFCGSPAYSAPERVCGYKYGFEVDYWSMGITAFEMMTGRLPWYNLDLQVLASRIVHEPLVFHEGECEQPAAADFISGVLSKVPSERPDIHGMKSHPFFRGFDWTSNFFPASPLPVRRPPPPPPQRRSSTATIKIGLPCSATLTSSDHHPEFYYQSEFIRLASTKLRNDVGPPEARSPGRHGGAIPDQRTTLSAVRRGIIKYIRPRPRLIDCNGSRLKKVSSLEEDRNTHTSMSISETHAECGGSIALLAAPVLGR
ncbi:hypothetical protein PC9H_000458 [Pleurotus ostreatus]|uniref:non-specific serine/threonine protein kinase n=1 Tax=Pleurotus ostreatus TaxID=5322 RepID=A0A8H7A483_PLEOS|nr:uncharacterized protein PC9H_000458 [Pleurotus ostreatus]KAF7440114.1 hypothetical protein PC9H_000458 [Pleurotus ostreatus]KAJ8700626.1 hypothetical protein PTI98_003636 [Pleurotus ostreatus]